MIEGILEKEFLIGTTYIWEFDPEVPVDWLLWLKAVPSKLKNGHGVLVDSFGDLVDIKINEVQKMASGEDKSIFLESLDKINIIKIGGHPSRFGNLLGILDPSEVGTKYNRLFKQVANRYKRVFNIVYNLEGHLLEEGEEAILEWYKILIGLEGKLGKTSVYLIPRNVIDDKYMRLFKNSVGGVISSEYLGGGIYSLEIRKTQIIEHLGLEILWKINNYGNVEIVDTKTP
ncbi:hypothetical protein PAP_04540 [Palaeococcus pacificus DY20341]|uniref:Uncharacterized protein n=1 Tax=Palaeococcus pacificus DY20341 TaxID=1343739 RepID=A0A075LSN6_9EURY|nr:hypothetical protein PAP_04540 [Palaeococcus pacificus DY20341]